MVTLSSEWTTREGITLVTAALTDVAEPTRVTLVNRLDGPVWPPRRQGVPACGWSDTGFEAVVAPGRHAFGYATPAPAADPAVELVEATPVPDADPTREAASTADAVCRDLGDPSPPPDALPATERDDGEWPVGTTHDASPPPSDLPESVVPFFEEIRGRVRRAEALAAVETLDEATEAVQDAGGLDGVRRLEDRQRDDVRLLRTVADRAETLAERRDAATIPTETLERLA
jgi:hypothetical protein